MIISNDPSDVEDRLKAAIVMKRIRIEEFFRDFDKLRKGRVTRPQFKSILSSTDLKGRIFICSGMNIFLCLFIFAVVVTLPCFLVVIGMQNGFLMQLDTWDSEQFAGVPRVAVWLV